MIDSSESQGSDTCQTVIQSVCVGVYVCVCICESSKVTGTWHGAMWVKAKAK